MLSPTRRTAGRPTRLRPAALALLIAPLAALTGCGGAPIPPPALDPLPDSVEARAARCAEVSAHRPEDLRAAACARHAMLRLGRRAALVEARAALRAADPTSGPRWYAEGLARLAADPEAARQTYEACAAAAEPAWCAAGLARVALETDEAAAALEHARAAATARPDEPTFAAIEAIALARTGAVEAAAARLAPLVVGWPEHLDVQRARAEIAIAADDLPTARDALARLGALAPDAAAPHVLAAALHRRLDEPEPAAAALRRAVAADREALAAREDLGRQLLAVDRAPAAVEVFSSLAEQRPDALRYALALGDALLAADAAERARAWADAARRIAPDDPRAALLTARAAIAAGDVDAGLALRSTLYTGPDAVAHRVAVAEALARAGRFTRAESEFSAAVIAHPESPRAWLAFARWLAARGALDRAEGLLRQAIGRTPEAAELHVALADVFERQGNRAGARLALGAAARLQPDVPAHEDELARVEFLDGELIEALARWEALVAAHPTADRPLRRLSAAYRALDEPEKALALLRRLVERHPGDAELKGRLGEVLLEAGRKEKAVGVLEAALAGGADAERLRPLLATALADTGRTADAADLFERALAADPGNRPLRLTYAAFRAATGDRAGAVELYQAQLARDPADLDARSGLASLLGAAYVEAAIDPRTHPRATVDAELAALAARAPPATGESDGAVLRDERRVVVDAGGVAEIHHRRAILIQRPSGVERYRTASVPFHVDHPPTVVRARTISPDGDEVPVAPADRVTKNPHAGTRLYGDGRQLSLTFSGLEVGAIVDYEIVTRRPHPDLEGVWWDGYVLANRDPTVQARYTLELPAEMPSLRRAEGMPPPSEAVEGGVRRLVWAADDLPPYREDTVAADAPLPSVRVSNLASWAEVDAWYHGLFGPRSRPGPAIEREARALTAGLSDRRARIAAIYRHVERSIGYLGVEFGIGAYQPRPPESTLAQRQGDCKDMTALMVALLAALDIEAHPALIKPRGQGTFDPEHPSPGQFSHVVLYVPDRDGGLWLDATAGLGTLDAVPAPLRGRHALIVDGRGGRLVTVPEGEPEKNRLVEQRTFALTPTGGGRLTVELTLTGDLAGATRRELLTLDAEGIEALLSAPGHLLEQGRIPDTVTVAGLHDPAAPVVLTAAVQHPDLVAVRLDGALVLPFDLSIFTGGPLARFGGDDGGPSPRSFERIVRLVPPPGYRFGWKPLAARADGPIALAVSERRRGDEAIVSARMRIGGAVDPGDKAALIAGARQMQAALGGDLAMLPGRGFDRVAFLEAIIAERPGQARLKTYLGQALLEADRPFEASVALLDALEADPDDTEAAMLMLLARERMGDPAQIEAGLRARVEGPDPPPTAVMALAALWTQTGRRAEAAALLERATDADSPTTLWIARAQVLLALDRLDEAAAVVEAVRALRPTEPMVLALVGDLAGRRGDRAAAIDAYRAAVRAAPEDPRLLNNLAWMLREDPATRDEALAIAEKAVALAPGEASAWDTLADLRFRSGDVAGALEANRRALDRAEEGDDRAGYEARRAIYEAAPK